MPRITNDEIERMRAIIDRDVHMLCDDNLLNTAFTRLAKLEQAVAFKGFDEMPEKDAGVDVVDVDGCIMLYGFDGTKYDCLDRDNGPWTASEMKAHGYLGWRYSVGDLSE